MGAFKKRNLVVNYISWAMLIYVLAQACKYLIVCMPVGMASLRSNYSFSGLLTLLISVVIASVSLGVSLYLIRIYLVDFAAEIEPISQFQPNFAFRPQMAFLAAVILFVCFFEYNPVPKLGALVSSLVEK